MNVIISCDKQSLPRSGDEHSLKEDLADVEDRDQGEESGELDDCAHVLRHLATRAQTVLMKYLTLRNSFYVK